MDQGNTGYLLLATALVLLMTPGLAFFYGGLVKAKSVISMMMMSFGAIGLIGVLWAIYGYAIAFPTVEGTGAPWLFDSSNFLLEAATADAAAPAGAYPTLAFVAFQATFAIITVALISGAIADRANEHRLQHAMLSQRIGQRGDFVGIELPARLKGVGVNLIDGDLHQVARVNKRPPFKATFLTAEQCFESAPQASLIHGR